MNLSDFLDLTKNKSFDYMNPNIDELGIHLILLSSHFEMANLDDLCFV